ncbi:hypothetical protein [Streptomyces corynorhini]|nr:hypothetical protein [Streptomyces corynorhini]
MDLNAAREPVAGAPGDLGGALTVAVAEPPRTAPDATPLGERRVR